METDQIFNVAQLLKETVGTHRDYDFAAPSLELSVGVAGRNLRGHVRLTRLNKSILTVGRAALDDVPLQCGRCLDSYSSPLAISFEDRYRLKVDLASGGKVGFDEEAANGEEEADALWIDQNHLLDLSELLRQVFLLALPLMPVCRPDCPGLPVPDGVRLNLGLAGAEQAEAAQDNRLAVLAKLLNGNN